MKENELKDKWGFRYLTKTFRITRITLFFMFAVFLQTFANEAYSQKTKLSMEYTNTRLEVVLDEIEELSEFYFVVNEKLVDLDRSVNLSVKNKKIDEILDILFAGTDVGYTITDRKIILAPSFLAENAQQQRTVSGKVTDSGGQPLPGVTVVVKGTTQGTVTDADGNYSLTNIPEDATLVFSFVGMQTQEVVVGTQTVINVMMEEEAIALEEVVAVGYGVQLREELTGSVSTVSSSELSFASTSDVVGRLQGRVSGVTVGSSNMPGGGSYIRIRGVGTINDPNPLYIIDGIPASPGTDLNPNNIESISILKDASSSAIYGTRGANGVVIITTKQGKEGAPLTVNFNVKTGISRVKDQYDLLNPSEFGELVWLEAKNRGLEPNHPFYGSGSQPVISDYILPAGAMEGDPAVNPDLYSWPTNLIQKANKSGTNWFKEITQTGLQQEYDLSVSGGTKNVTYAFSGGYLNHQGAYIHTGFNRYSFMSNVSAKATNWLNIGQTLSVSRTQADGLRTDNSEASPISQTYRMQTIVPVYDIMGNYAGTRAPTLGVGKNPVALLDRNKHDYNRNIRILGSFFGEAKILDFITFRSTIGYDFGMYNTRDLELKDPESAEPRAEDTFSQNANESFQWNWSNTLNFNKTFNEIHRFSAILGTEAIENKYESMYAERSKYFTTNPNYMRLSSGEINQLNSGSGSEWSLFSIFGRVNYNFQSKYFLEATIRRDGSSRFSSKNRYATFPAASFAWALSSEDFMQWASNWLDLAKIRIGWGVTGNDRIGNYNSFSTFDTHSSNSAAPMTGSNTSSIMGFRPATIGNPDVTWETTETINLGFDGKVLNNSIDFGFDVWKRNTSDMLYRVLVPVVSGVATHPFINIGTMENKGFDIELGYNNTAFSNQFRYGANLSLSHYVNKIVRLSDNVEEEIVTGSLRQISYSRATTGTAFPEFYGYIVEGIFQTQAEADAHPTAFGKEGTYNRPGHFKYKDVNKDGVINPEDMTYIGNPHPDLVGGLNIDLGYGNFDLNLFFYGSYGNDMINYVRRWIDYPQFLGARSKDRLYSSWGSPYLDNNTNAKLPMADLDDGSYQPSTHFVEDGSFIRLKNVRLNYTVPSEIINKYLQGISIYLQATNLFTITKYSGLDPELNATGTNIGLDQGAMPVNKQTSIGISFIF